MSKVTAWLARTGILRVAHGADRRHDRIKVQSRARLEIFFEEQLERFE